MIKLYIRMEYNGKHVKNVFYDLLHETYTKIHGMYAGAVRIDTFVVLPDNLARKV